jgi:hypothetical protein
MRHGNPAKRKLFAGVDAEKQVSAPFSQRKRRQFSKRIFDSIDALK